MQQSFKAYLLLPIVLFVVSSNYQRLLAKKDTQYRSWSECPSWTMYLYNHPGYQNYHPPSNIIDNGCEWGTWITFPQKIEAIAAKVGTFTHPIDLFRSKDFLVMYKHANYYYYQSIVDYLADKSPTLAQKKIALYAASNTVSQDNFQLLKDSYKLYKDQKIDLVLLELIFTINLGNYIVDRRVGSHLHGNVLKTLSREKCEFLERVTKEIDTGTSFYKNIKSILGNRFPASWHQYLIFYSIINDSYYMYPLPFLDIITHAVREQEAWKKKIRGDLFVCMETAPYFLMIMEHPIDYYPYHFEPWGSREDGIKILRETYSNEIKSMAILGMSQIGVYNAYESSSYYACCINNACEWYQQGNLSVEHLYQLFKCNFPTFYKYPFFILDYKKPAVQDALNKFIAVPTIPEGLKVIARKIKNGTLATKEEMAYMEGYRQFRKTHFTLYETIPPREDVG